MDLYRSGPLAGVACSCDEARGRIYKGGPLPLWTTCRHHIITKEKYIQSYLMLTFSRRPVRHARPWSEWNCHLGDSSVVGGRGALDVLIQHHPALPRESCRALLCTRTVSCLVCMRTNSLALNGSGPAAAVCRRKPSLMIAYHKLGVHELGAWRRAVVRRLDLGASIRAPRLVAGSYLQQHQESLGPGEGGGNGRLPPGHSGRL